MRTIAPEAPTGIVLPAYLGATLVLVESFFLLAGGSEPFGVGIPTTSASAGEFGGLGLATGVAIVAVLFALHENPGQRLAVGLLLIVLGALSAVSGGGFVAGLALTVVAGLEAVLHGPSSLYVVDRRGGRDPPPAK